MTQIASGEKLDLRLVKRAVNNELSGAALELPTKSRAPLRSAGNKMDADR